MRCTVPAAPGVSSPTTLIRLARDDEATARLHGHAVQVRATNPLAAARSRGSAGPPEVAFGTLEHLFGRVSGMDTVMGDSSTDSFGVDEVGSVPTERLEAELVGWSARLAAALGRWLVLLGEYDRRGAYEAWGCWSCVQWVVWQCGLDPRSAREHLRVARALQELPLVSTARLRSPLVAR